MKTKCPKCKAKLPSYLVDSRDAGRKGGSVKNPKKGLNSDQARAAAKTRWDAVRAKKMLAAGKTPQ